MIIFVLFYPYDANPHSWNSLQTLFTDTPINSSLYSLYIHQNYTQFCDEIEQCESIAEWVSWADWNESDFVSHPSSKDKTDILYSLPLFEVVSSKSPSVSYTNVGNITFPPNSGRKTIPKLCQTSLVQRRQKRAGSLGRNWRRPGLVVEGWSSFYTPLLV